MWQSPLNCYISILLILPIVLFFYLRRWAWSPHCKNRFYIVNIISLMYLTINPRRSNVYIFYFIHPIINNRTRVIAWNIILLILLKKISPNLRTNQKVFLSFSSKYKRMPTTIWYEHSFHGVFPSLFATYICHFRSLSLLDLRLSTAYFFLIFVSGKPHCYIFLPSSVLHIGGNMS